MLQDKFILPITCLVNSVHFIKGKLNAHLWSNEKRRKTHNSFFFSKALVFFVSISQRYRHGKQVFEDDSSVAKFNELKHRSFFDRAKKRHH